MLNVDQLIAAAKGEMEVLVTPQSIERRYKYHPPTPDQIPKYEAIRSHVIEFAKATVAIVPVCEETVRAIELLDQVHFLLNAAIARHSGKSG